MTILIPLIVILIAEYVGDFLLQNREMALNKSKDITVLFAHLVQIFIMLCIGLYIAIIVWFQIPAYVAILFSLSYCLIHGIQDWYIWKGYQRIVYHRFKNKVESAKDKDGKYHHEYSHNQAIQYCELFKKNKDYAEDKVYYDFIGLDRLLHIITIIILYGVFFL